MSKSKQSYHDLDNKIKELQIQKSLMIDEDLRSNSVGSILKAQNYLQSLERNKDEKKVKPKAWMFQPDETGYTGAGYKESYRTVSFAQLKQISKLFAVQLIFSTRKDQVKNFLQFTTDEQKEGFTITKQRGLFDVETGELSKDEQKEVSRIVDFLDDCGNNSKWDNGDSFQEFIAKILNDSLTYDQLGFECIRSNDGELQKIVAIDASTLRYLDSSDPRHIERFKALEWKGYLPKYCQVHLSNILINPITGQQVMFYPWELGWGIRNKISDVNKNGYGTSEIETGIQLITWILHSFQYNGNFFSQGSQPKGFINIKEGGMDNTTLNEFKQSWREMVTGVSNSHKIPVFEGIDLEWHDLQKGNREMEFNKWMEFLLVIFCSLYRIDPSELGFNFAAASTIFGQDGQKERLKHSKSKGLKPLLIFLQEIINKYIVSELNPEYSFKFTGIDIEDEDEQVTLDDKKLKAGVVSFESMFEKYMGRKFNPKSDTILNQVFQQAQQAKQFGGEGMNEMVDEENGTKGQGVQNPFEEFGKAEMDEITKASINKINDLFTNKK
jgi:hypothetical protein